eukprot:scaffold201045_cov30-Tisochrysis_lutea.AAC.3
MFYYFGGVSTLALWRHGGVHGLVARIGGLNGERGGERRALDESIVLTIVVEYPYNSETSVAAPLFARSVRVRDPRPSASLLAPPPLSPTELAGRRELLR